MTETASATFTENLLRWYHDHGRKQLPWKARNHDDPAYPVWISEIMLQQTQVSTVIPYFERFMTQFPDIDTLAAAPLDDVLGHWSGLGYYARARNIHKSAHIIVNEYDGRIPQTLDEIVSLPGIGQSTAGAILALAYNQAHPILDGNVKRVLTRVHMIAGDPTTTKINKQLWSIATELTPTDQAANYTQAIMDLGATICHRRKPDCTHCPVQNVCQAFQSGRQEEFPTPKPKRTRPQKKTTLWIIINDGGGVLLKKQAEKGIWPGLFSFPEQQQLDDAQRQLETLGIFLNDYKTPNKSLSNIKHSFTHFDLIIEAKIMHIPSPTIIAEPSVTSWRWYHPEHTPDLARPSLVNKLLSKLP